MTLSQSNKSNFTVTFMHLGHQCPYTQWFGLQAEALADSLEAQYARTDLTGDSGAGAAAGAYCSMQIAVPGHPLLAAPRPVSVLLDCISKAQSQNDVARSAAVLPPADATTDNDDVFVLSFGPQDDDWAAAVAATVAVCLSQPEDPRREQATAAKLEWFRQVSAMDGSPPVILLAGSLASPLGFLELVPAAACQVPLPHPDAADYFLTCVHAVGGGGSDPRGRLIDAALAAAPGAIWAVSGECSPYPNGPWPLFAAAGFGIVAHLGQTSVTGRGFDRALLVRSAARLESGAPVVGLVLSDADNVVTVPSGCPAGATIALAGAGSGGLLDAAQDIPPGHKAALRDLGSGEAIIKYGQAIGVAGRDIGAGQHVHVHNLLSGRAGGSSRLARNSRDRDGGRE